jgi:hypothetical protein
MKQNFAYCLPHCITTENYLFNYFFCTKFIKYSCPLQISSFYHLGDAKRMFPDSNSRIQTVPYFPDFHFIVRETYLHLYLFKFQEYEMYTYIKIIAPGFKFMSLAWYVLFPVLFVLTFSNYQLNAQFFYSSTIRMLHYDPQHVSSSTLLILRRTNCITTASGIVTLCKQPYSMQAESGLQSALHLHTVRL